MLYDPAIPLLGIHLDKTVIQKDTHTPMFPVALFTTAKTWKKHKFPWTDEWIKKMYVYTHTHIYIYICITEYYSAIKNERMPSVAWMETEIIILR